MLHQAERTRRPVPLLSQSHPGMSVEDAYRVSRAWASLKVAQGRAVVGHKIGLTSKAMQRAAQIDEPDYGVLTDEMLLPENSGVPFERFINPKVEVELAFLLGASLTGPIGVCDVLRATEYVVPAIEIIDSRFEVGTEVASTRRIQDTIADNASSGALILGGRPVTADSIDLRWCSAILSRNAVVEETGVAAGVLNHPAAGVAWLARKLAPWGEPLGAGEIVLSGSFVRPLPVAAGDVVSADFGPLGTVSCSFSANAV